MPVAEDGAMDVGGRPVAQATPGNRKAGPSIRAAGWQADARRTVPAVLPPQSAMGGLIVARHRCSCRVCQAVHRRDARYRARQRESRKLDGRCPECGKVAPPNQRKCRPCNQKKMVAQNRRSRARLAAGLCVYCGKCPPVQGKAGCQKDLDAFKRTARITTVRRRIMQGAL